MEFAETSVIEIVNGEVHLHVTNVAEARIAVKEIKLKKKELNLLKRQLIAEQKQLRTNHAANIHALGPAIRGRGTISRMFLAAQRASRQNARSGLEGRFAALEVEKQNIERDKIGFDSLLFKLESYIVQNS